MNRLTVTFTFGVGFRGNGDAILLHEQCEGIDEICARAVELFGGFTRVNTTGGWRVSGSAAIAGE